MAKGNQEFCKVDTDFILNDPRFAKLTGDEVKFYLFLWAAAVHERTETPRAVRDLEIVSGRILIPTVNIVNALVHIGNGGLGLVKYTENEDGTYIITVSGAKSKHKQLVWGVHNVNRKRSQCKGGREGEGEGEESERENEKGDTPLSPRRPSPFDEVVLPTWDEWAKAGYVRGYDPSSELFATSRKRVNKAWGGKHGIGQMWGKLCEHLPKARFVTETWKPGFEVLTRRSRNGTLHREAIVNGDYDRPGTGSSKQPPKGEYLQVGDEYDNIGR